MVFCLLSCARHEAQAIRDPTNQELDDIQREFQVERITKRRSTSPNGAGKKRRIIRNGKRSRASIRS